MQKRTTVVEANDPRFNHICRDRTGNASRMQIDSGVSAATIRIEVVHTKLHPDNPSTCILSDDAADRFRWPEKGRLQFNPEGINVK